MESPNPNANIQSPSDGSNPEQQVDPSLNPSEEAPSLNPSEEALSLNPSEEAPPNPEEEQPQEDPLNPEPQEDPLNPEPQEDPLNLDQDREYGCKYCDKKFTNKQALGGHQNAHKVERAMERNVREMPGVPLGYFGGGLAYPGMAPANPFLINRPYPPQQPLQHGIHIGHNPRIVLPMPRPTQPYPLRPRLSIPTDPFVPPRPLPGFNNVYPGWTASVPRNPQFPGQPSSNVHNQNQAINRGFLTLGPSGSSFVHNPNQAINRGFLTLGPSGSSYGFRPPAPDQGPSTSAAPRFRPQGNLSLARGNNNQMNDARNQEEDDHSDLDLTLKLSNY